MIRKYRLAVASMGVAFILAGGPISAAQHIPMCPGVAGTYYNYRSILTLLTNAMTALETCDKSLAGQSSCAEAYRNLSDMDTAIDQILTYNSEEKRGVRCLKGCSIDVLVALSVFLEFEANNLETQSGQLNTMENTRLIMEQHRRDPLCSTITAAQSNAGAILSAYATGVFVNNMGSAAPDPEFADPTKALGPPDWDHVNFGKGFVSLGCGGQLTLTYSSGASMNVGQIRVVEIGTAVEATRVEAQTARGWIDVGEVRGSVDTVSLAAPEPVFAVRLTDLKANCGVRTPGADIDAVEIIGQ